MTSNHTHRFSNTAFGFAIVLMCFAVSVSGAPAAKDKTFHWPHGAKAAVNLAYDDALDSQLDYAIPTLNKYKLKGTFYIPAAAQTMTTRLEEWRKVAKQGHELGNHSIFHQCSKSIPGRDWVAADRDLDKVSVIQMQDQVRVNSTFLNAIDGKTERTYTPPCVDTQAGGQNYLDGLRSDFVAFKSLGDGISPSMTELNPYSVGVYFPSGVTGEQLIEFVKQAKAKGTMANLTFHGVGGDYLDVSAEAHAQLVKYLAEHQDIYWTDTFLNIMKYVKQEQGRIKAP